MAWSELTQSRLVIRVRLEAGVRAPAAMSLAQLLERGETKYAMEGWASSQRARARAFWQWRSTRRERVSTA